MDQAAEKTHALIILFTYKAPSLKTKEADDDDNHRSGEYRPECGSEAFHQRYLVLLDTRMLSDRRRDCRCDGQANRIAKLRDDAEDSARKRLCVSWKRIRYDKVGYSK